MQASAILTKTRSSHPLASLFSGLGDSGYQDYVNQNLLPRLDMLSDVYELVEQLKEIPEANYTDVILHYRHYIQDFNQLDIALAWISKERRLEVILQCVDKIKHAVQLKTVFSYLPQEKYQEVALLCIPNFEGEQGFDEMLLQLATAEEIAACVSQYEVSHLEQDQEENSPTPEWNEELFWSLQHLSGKESRFKQALKYRARIQQGYHLVHALETLLHKHRLGLVLRCLAVIEDGKQLALVIATLAGGENYRLKIVALCEAKIQNGDELAEVVKWLPREKIQGVILNQVAKIQDGDELAKVLHGLREDKEISKDIALKCIIKIKTKKQLENVLSELHRDVCLDVALVCRALIQNVKELLDIFFYLPKAHMLEMALSCLDKIHNRDEFDAVRYRLSEEDYPTFILKFLDKIQDMNEFKSVFDQLPRINRREIIKRYIAQIHDGEKLNQVLILAKDKEEVAGYIRMYEAFQKQSQDEGLGDKARQHLKKMSVVSQKADRVRALHLVFFSGKRESGIYEVHQVLGVVRKIGLEFAESYIAKQAALSWYKFSANDKRLAQIKNLKAASEQDNPSQQITLLRELLSERNLQSAILLRFQKKLDDTSLTLKGLQATLEKFSGLVARTALVK